MHQLLINYTNIMKKLAFIIMCVCALVSCSQDNDLVVEKDSSEVELRASSDNFLSNSNLHPLYEYCRRSGGEPVDYYYSNTQNWRGLSKRGYTYTYERFVGYVGKNIVQYGGYTNEIVYHLVLLYNRNTQQHEVQRYSLNADIPYVWESRNKEKVEDLGYIVTFMDFLFDDYDMQRRNNGSLDYLRVYYHKTRTSMSRVSYDFESSNSIITIDGDFNRFSYESLGWSVVGR